MIGGKKMKKVSIKKWVVLVVLTLLVLSATAFASNNVEVVKLGEVLVKDWFVAGQSIINQGTVKGDMIAAGQNISSEGAVQGDLICAASDINALGPVAGNMRAAAANIITANSIGKNTNLFAAKINMKNASVVGGNLTAFAKDINIDGKVKGYTILNGQTIVLNGEFFGDVKVYNGDASDPDDQNASLTVLPGTIIHGKLIYTGVSAPKIQQGAQIAKTEIIKQDIAKEKQAANKKQAGNSVWGFVKLLFTTGVYFLIAMLIYRFIPGTFKYMGDVIREKPLKIAGIGLIGFASTFAAFVVFVVLLVFALIMSPSIGLIFGVSTTLFYILLFYFSTIPAALWLGNLMLKERLSLPQRFGAGLFTIAIILFALNLLKGIPAIAPAVGLLAFVIGFLVFILGTGALLSGMNHLIRGIKDSNKEKEVEG
jgi:cytoskeletal protein CcmA (bactofilin family)